MRRGWIWRLREGSVAWWCMDVRYDVMLGANVRAEGIAERRSTHIYGIAWVLAFENAHCGEPNFESARRYSPISSVRSCVLLDNEKPEERMTRRKDTSRRLIPYPRINVLRQINVRARVTYLPTSLNSPFSSPVIHTGPDTKSFCPMCHGFLNSPCIDH